MKKLIYMLLAATMFASLGSQSAFAKAFQKNNFDGTGTPRTRGMIYNDGNLTPLVNDDFALQVDFRFPDTYLPFSFGSAFGIFTRTGTPSLNQSNGFTGYPNNPPYVGFMIFPPQSSDAPNGPVRYLVQLGTGSSSFVIKQGLAVTADGLQTVNYDHLWHRIQFATTGLGTGVAPATVNFSIDGISFLALTGQTNLPMSTGGNFALQFQGVQNQAIPAGHNAALDNIMLDNIRTATSLANLATATTLFNEDYESFALGDRANGNNGTQYVMGVDNANANQGAANDTSALAGASPQTSMVGQEESDWINVIGGPVGSLPRGGCIYLNAIAAGSRYNLVANDYTTNANDQVGVQADIKFPAGLTGAVAVTSGVVAGITIRLRGTIGGNDATANEPGIEYQVGVTNSVTPVFKFNIVNRTASNSAGTTLASITSAIPFDHKWHRVRAKITQAGTAPSAGTPTPNNFNYPTLVFDGANVIAGTNNAVSAGTFLKTYNTGSGATGFLSYPLDSNVVIPATVTPTAAPTPTPTLVTNNGFFPGGNNLTAIPTTPAATVFPNPATASATTYVAQDEFFSISQKMNVALASNTLNIRWDNITTINAVSSGTGAAATRGTDVAIARIDDLSSYGVTSVGGVVANNTLVSAAPKSATLADPWYTDATAGGSNPAQWSIDVTDNSTFGISSVNAVNDFYLY